MKKALFRLYALLFLDYLFFISIETKNAKRKIELSLICKEFAFFGEKERLLKNRNGPFYLTITDDCGISHKNPAGEG